MLVIRFSSWNFILLCGFTLGFLLNSSPVTALDDTYQVRVDSIFNVLDSTKQDSNLAKNYIALARIYLTRDYNASEKYARLALNVSEKIEDTARQGHAHYLIGYSVYYTIDLQTSLEHYQKALDLYTLKNMEKDMVTMIADMAYIYGDLGQLEKQIEYLKTSEDILEKMEDWSTLATIYNNLGLAFSNLGDRKKATAYYEKSAALREEKGMLERIAIVYLNIGLNYLSDGDTVKALEFYQKGYDNAYKYDNQFGKVIGNQRFGGYYSSIGEIDKAREYYHKAYEIDQSSNNLEGVSLDLYHLANLDIREGNYRAAEKKSLEALKINEQLNLYVRQTGQYEQLTSIYRELGNYKQALEYQTKAIKINDSLGNAEVIKTIEELEEKYQNEKKQAAIDQLEASAEKDKLVIENQKLQTTFILIGLSLVSVMLIISTYAFIQKRKDNREIAEQRHQLMEANEELNQTNEEISAQRDQIEVQKEILRHRNEHITSSINYAKKIQEALLKSEEHASILPEHFIVFMPKDIVSGDFYWIHQKENTLYVAVADCTGHGVPGAFLTMLGTSFLNEIISDPTSQTPAEILDKLRNRIVRELSISSQEVDVLDASSTEDIVKDGMDISLVKMVKNQPEIEWAGANNPVFLLTSNADTIERFKSKKSILNESKSLVVVSGDKQPIGYARTKKPFTNHTISLDKGDSVYLFSDGFADQFGGEDKGKYGYKKFRELLFQNSSLPMKTQEEALKEELTQWIKAGKEEQLDDVCIIGLRI